MSDEPPPKPPLTKPTAAQLAEGRAKRLAYEEQRRRYTQTWRRQLADLPDEPEEAPEQAQEPQPGKKRGSRARSMIHDPRQRRFDV
jgi:hypothetical protein